MKLRIAAILLSALLATVDVACFSKPDPPQLGNGDGSVPTGHADAAMALFDATLGPQGCPLLADFHGSSTGCSNGFTPTNGGATIYYNGTLNFLLPMASGMSGICAGPGVPFNFSSVFVKIVMLPAQGASSWFALNIGSVAQLRVNMLSTDGTTGTATVTCPVAGSAMTSLGVSTPFTIEIKGDGASNQSFTVSVIGSTTKTLATCTGNGAAMPAIAQMGATSGSSTVGSTASFDDLEACP